MTFQAPFNGLGAKMLVQLPHFTMAVRVWTLTRVGKKKVASDTKSWQIAWVFQRQKYVSLGTFILEKLPFC